MKTKFFTLFAAFTLLFGAKAMAQTTGDVNEDGVVNEQDIEAIIQIMQEAGGVAEATKYYWYAGWTEPTAANIATIVNETYPNANNSTVYNPAGTDPGTDPTEIKYVLMGVGGDWANGIDMTANPDNADEYMLLGQTISEGDSVKVVRLEDGVAKHWCGAVKEGVTVNITPDDKMGNIILTPGLYDFYYDVAADAIWIAEAAQSAIDNVVLENKATKVIRNGQMYIIRDEVMFNVLGQVVE